MKLLSIPALILGVWGWVLGSQSVLAQGGPVRVQGIPGVVRVLKTAAPELRTMGIEVKFGEDCGNSQAIAALGAGEIDIAMVGRPLTAEDRATYPDRAFEEIKIGAQVVVLLISRPVWESGVHALKKEQVIELYEGRTQTWQEFGGEKRSTKFFEPAHGQGVWEIFATWLYGDVRKAPAVPWEVVSSGEQAQNAVQFFSSGASVAALRWADRKEVFPAAIIDESGTAIEPTPENVAAGKYPMARTAYMILGSKPAGNRRKLVEFLQSEKGQTIVLNSDLLPLNTIKSGK